MSAPELNDKHRVLLMTAYSAGLRVSELVRLQPKDILSDRLQIRVVQGKGRKDRYTVLSAKLLEELRRYGKLYRPEAWLFPSANAGWNKHLNGRTAQRVFDRPITLAGLPVRGGIHLLRHSFATHLLEAGVALPVWPRMMGHRALFSTTVYLHVSRDCFAQVKSPLDLVDIERLRHVP